MQNPSDTDSPIINPITGKPVTERQAPSMNIQEKPLANPAVLREDRFAANSSLDGCYVLKDGRLVLRIALYGTPSDSKLELVGPNDERLIGWTYIDVTLAERLIKRSRTQIKLGKKGKR